jgi:cell division protein FtsB
MCSPLLINIKKDLEMTYKALSNITTSAITITKGRTISEEKYNGLPDKYKKSFIPTKGSAPANQNQPIGDTPEEKIKREALFAKEVAPFKKQIADLTDQNKKLVDEAAKTETLLKAHEENVKNLNAEKEKLTADVEALTKQIADLTAPKVEVKGNVVADAPAKADKPKSGR